MDQHWHQEPTLREIAEEANKVKAEKLRKETDMQVEAALTFLRKKAAHGLFSVEYSGPLNEGARRRLTIGREKLKIERAGGQTQDGPIWSIKW